jgi:hypothetical protein
MRYQGAGPAFPARIPVVGVDAKSWRAMICRDKLLN